MNNVTERRPDNVIWLRLPPRGVGRLTNANRAHFASVPSLPEWAYNWRLEHGRDPTKDEIDHFFVNADADDPEYNVWADNFRLKHGRWPTNEEIDRYCEGDEG